MAKKMNSEVLGVVENMAYYQCLECGHKDYIFGENGGESLATSMQSELLGKLPLVSELRHRSDRVKACSQTSWACPEEGQSGKPMIFDEPEADISQEFFNIAKRLAEKAAGFDENIEPLKLKMEVE
ncbi:Mrp/NBP35 family ATP-binding protein [Halanaerobium sp. Z-7514]|uniref:Mrp/NBP35 family ATP-binding protein n=2 Tax=Halanaerobium polyolivorans TaxID=2886943 RepID=A0AAW4X143_9FIRM|nr:Mrp/NBP35 family ATP-binding protein [Halanaerobium polyolivorans]